MAVDTMAIRDIFVRATDATDCHTGPARSLPQKASLDLTMPTAVLRALHAEHCNDMAVARFANLLTGSRFMSKCNWLETPLIVRRCSWVTAPRGVAAVTQLRGAVLRQDEHNAMVNTQCTASSHVEPVYYSSSVLSCPVDTMERDVEAEASTCRFSSCVSEGHRFCL